ncbi:MAG: hypothetical protein ABMA64_21880 [Myxococcota bacterium]
MVVQAWLGWIGCDARVEDAGPAARVAARAGATAHAQVCDAPVVEPTAVVSVEVTATELDPTLAQAEWELDGASGTGDPFPNQTHRLALPVGGPTRDELVLILPGTAQECAQFTTLVDTAASYGFAALCLGYPNQPMVAETCAGSDDPACSEGVRTEILYGLDASPLLALTSENSVAGRLAVALDVLHAAFPADGWDRYLGPDGVVWDQVAAVGFSQGAGHVSLLARDHALSRAVLLSGGCDPSVEGRSAWCTDPRATPLDHTFLYWHRDEPAAAELASLADALGQGPAVDVDTSGLGCARALTTGQETAQTHGVVAVDGAIAVDDAGAPVDAAVYQWLLLADALAPWRA